jgi:hypothetical protein
MTTTNITPLHPTHAAGAAHPEAGSAQLAGVPRQLWLRQALIVGLTLLVALVGLRTYLAYANVVQTIGKDSVPSIVAAEKIRTELADAHTAIVNVFLTREQDEAGPSRKAYAKAMASADDSLVAAAQNITYGEDERRPILAALTRLAEYERLIGMADEARLHEAARADGADGRDVELLARADALMREQILPAIVALDLANFTHVDAAFTEGQHTARQWLTGFVVLAVVLGAIMLETQLKLFASFRRILNLPMAAGLAVFAVALIAFGTHAAGILSEIRLAKEDAFDSVHALSKAEAVAYSANAQESVYLLLRDKAAKARQGALFNSAAQEMFSGHVQDINHLPADWKTLKGQGLLGDELANITFYGEDAAASQTLQGWLQYVQIDGQIRALEESGKHDAAVALCLGTQPLQSDWAFGRFMKSLDATLEINQRQFDQAIERAFHDAAWLWMLLIAVLLAPIAGTVIGLQMRLAEFRD